MTRVLAVPGLIVPDRAIFTEAGLLPLRGLRPLDAIHVATAPRTSRDAFVTYDTRQTEAAEAYGLKVESPGRPDPGAS